MDPNKYPYQSNLIKILESTSYLALATLDREVGVWANTLNFAYDKELNMYFVSKTSSRHCQNILKDSKISAAIYSTEQQHHEYVKGIQLIGEAAILGDEYVDFASNIYHGRNNIFFDPSILNTKYQKSSIWKFFIIKPSAVWIYDTEFLGDLRAAIPQKYLKLP